MHKREIELQVNFVETITLYDELPVNPQAHALLNCHFFILMNPISHSLTTQPSLLNLKGF